MLTLDRGRSSGVETLSSGSHKVAIWTSGKSTAPLSEARVTSWELRAICTSRFVVDADGGVCVVTLDRGRSSGEETLSSGCHKVAI